MKPKQLKTRQERRVARNIRDSQPEPLKSASQILPVQRVIPTLEAISISTREVPESAVSASTTTKNSNAVWPLAGIDWYYADDSCAIACSDCRDVLPSLPKADLVLTDPPYGISYDARGGGGTAKSRSLARRTQFAVPTVKGDHEPFDPRFLLPLGRRQMIWGGHVFYHLLPSGGRFLIWKKRESAADSNMDFADAELCWDSQKGLARILTHRHNGFMRKLGDMEIPVHPTQKPLNVMMWCLSFANDAQTVLDPFMGSGTTLRAAKDLGRKAIGIEIEEKYCEIAANRLRQEALQFQ